MANADTRHGESVHRRAIRLKCVIRAIILYPRSFYLRNQYSTMPYPTPAGSLAFAV